MRTRALPVLLLASFLAAPSGLAAAELYVGGGVGGEVPDSDEGAAYEDFTRLAEDDGRKLYAGVRLGEHLAVEGAYHDFGDRTCCPEIADAGYISTVDAFALAGVGRWPVGRFELFGKAGVLQWKESGDRITIAGPRPFSSDGSDLLLGVGASVLLLEHLAARVEWEAFDLGAGSADTAWLLLELRF